MLQTTHCWGIGLGRTGTNSLCQAFKILGFKNVVHNPIFEQLRYINAGADNGVTLYYKYLDYIHPNSKFVLTVRDMESWLPSIQYITEARPIDSAKMHDESIKRRMLIYESVTFDAYKFSKAYYYHYENVRSYFKDRPKDLLIINIMAGDGWDKLCEFLNCNIPSVSFPNLNNRPRKHNTLPFYGR